MLVNPNKSHHKLSIADLMKVEINLIYLLQSLLLNPGGSVAWTNRKEISRNFGGAQQWLSAICQQHVLMLLFAAANLNNYILEKFKTCHQSTKMDCEILFLASKLFKNGPTLATFIVYFWSFQTNIITIFTTNVCEKMSIHYAVLGFEPTTFRTSVSSHNR